MPRSSAKLVCLRGTFSIILCCLSKKVLLTCLRLPCCENEPSKIESIIFNWATNWSNYNYIDSSVLVCIFNAAAENKQNKTAKSYQKKKGKKNNQSSLKEIPQSYLRVRECDIVDKGGGQIMV